MTRSSIAAALLAVALLSLSALPAIAHAELVSASPGPDEVVIGSPDELVAEFDQDLNPSRTSFRVRDDTRAIVAEGGQPGESPREWQLDLPELAPGEYLVQYTSFSAEDGEIHRGDYSFTVEEAVASPTPPPLPSPTTRATAAASVAPSASPNPAASSTPAASPTPSISASPSAVPSAGPGTDGGTSFDTSIVLPILVVLAVVAGLGLWLMRRRTT